MDGTWLLSSESIIRFGESKFSVLEPGEVGQVSLVRIPVVRVGDSSKVSVVRVHTKDGSATSGEDYHPISEGEKRFHATLSANSHPRTHKHTHKPDTQTHAHNPHTNKNAHTHTHTSKSTHSGTHKHPPTT